MDRNIDRQYQEAIELIEQISQRPTAKLIFGFILPTLRIYAKSAPTIGKGVKPQQGSDNKVVPMRGRTA